MKKFLLCVVALFLFGSSMAQKDVTGFWGIPFGSSVDDVKNVMKDRGVLLMDEPENSDIGLVYKNCSFAGNQNCIVLTHFVDDKMYNALVEIRHDQYSLFTKFDSMTADLTAKYGTPTKVTKKFELPYYDGDGYELEAIKEDKASFLSHWIVGENKIMLYISEHLTLILSYWNTALDDLASEREAKASSSDY